MKLKLLIFIGCLSILSGCEKALLKPVLTDDVESTFEAFWTIVDENYCFFEEKKVDWDALYDANRSNVKNGQTTNMELRIILDNMLQTLEDGHVSLRIGRTQYTYDVQAGFPINFDLNLLVDNYLNNNPTYENDGKFITAVIEDVIYYYISSFGSEDAGGPALNPTTIANDFDALLDKYPNTKGIIIDVRNNSGGNPRNAEVMLSRLIQTPAVSMYLKSKNGPGSQDFAEPTAYEVQPRGTLYEKPVVVLTNRSSYSAANYFAAIMQDIPQNVTLIGGRTGGGGSIPVYKDLPNGWLVRLSTSQFLRPDLRSMEMGIEPDIAIDMTPQDSL